MPQALGTGSEQGIVGPVLTPELEERIAARAAEAAAGEVAAAEIAGRGQAREEDDEDEAQSFDIRNWMNAKELIQQYGRFFPQKNKRKALWKVLRAHTGIRSHKVSSALMIHRGDSAEHVRQSQNGPKRGCGGPE